MFTKLIFGKKAEDYALKYLENAGLKLIQRNYRCYYGEIDLIMHDKDNIVFVEVRSKSTRQFGKAIESINHPKQQKILKTAYHFLQCKPYFASYACRFDFIVLDTSNKTTELEWVKNTFYPTN